MRKHLYKIGLAGSVLSFVLISGTTALALAPQASVHAQAATTTTDDGSNGTTGTEAQDSTQSATNESTLHGQGKLAQGRLKACENRQKAITNIMSRIADRGKKQLALFGTIATRTETFYMNKGKTLSTYNSLVADVNAKAATAQTAVSNLSTESTGFTCGGSNPKGFVSSFQAGLKTEIGALQDYKTSVKNLIVGVKSVQSTDTNIQSTGGTTNEN